MHKDTPVSSALRAAIQAGSIRSGFDSGWVDDGYDDTFDLGLADVEMRVRAELYISDSQPVREGPATFGSSTAGATTNTHTDTVTGGATGTLAPGGMGGGGNGSYAVADASAFSATNTTTGSMVLPAVVERAKAHLEIELTMNHTLASPVSLTRMAEVGTVFYQRLALY